VTTVVLREDAIHYHARRGLELLDWRLLAGQYPNGSDDELPCLSVVDSRLARDRSPDPRRHSLNKLVPDLLAVRRNLLMVIEMKPGYNPADELKLIELMTTRRNEFDEAFARLSTQQNWGLDPADLVFLPCLGFSEGTKYPARPDFCYLTIDGSHRMRLIPNGTLEEEMASDG
jgi:hypothetical protein